MRRAEWLTARPIAHRGLFDASDGRPENSLPAFERAVERGVAFELDVQLTEGGALAVVHDASVPDGAGGQVAVADLTAARLRRLRIGPCGERIPLLGEVLDLVAGRVPVVVDVRRWRLGLRPALEAAVAAEVRGYPGPLALQSFDPVAVCRLRRLAADLPVGQISGELRSRGRLVAAVGQTMVTNFVTRPDFVSYELSHLPSRFAGYWRGRGCPLIAFPVRSPADERRAAALADNFFFAGYLPPACGTPPPLPPL